MENKRYNNAKEVRKERERLLAKQRKEEVNKKAKKKRASKSKDKAEEIHVIKPANKRLENTARLFLGDTLDIARGSKTPKNSKNSKRSSRNSELSYEEDVDVVIDNRRQKVKSSRKIDKEVKGLRNRETNVISFFFVALFILMAGYLVYFNYYDAERIVNNTYNKRIDNQSKKVLRGDIVASDGTVLATSERGEDDVDVRNYPFGDLYCHVVGVDYSVRTGIEAKQNFNLLTDNSTVLQQMVADVIGEKTKGDTVVTTLDPKLQEACYDALGENKGAVIAMNPYTGEILSMVSKPGYDPNLAASDYTKWMEYDSADSVLLNRATQGLYPPGSTFKILTALAYIRQHEDYDNYSYTCRGVTSTEGGGAIHCIDYSVHGRENLKQAFANSCNTAFSTMGLDLDVTEYRKMCDTFLFNSSLPVDFESSKSSFTLNAESGSSLVQQTAFGQGKTMISPLQNMLIASSIANAGVMMKPYVVNRVVDQNNNIVEESIPEEMAVVMTPDEASVLTEYMEAVCKNGTGTVFYNVPYYIAAKTGTAQYGDSVNEHSWITLFSNNGEKTVAMSIILEGGYSGEKAQYVAKNILDRYYE